MAHYLNYTFTNDANFISTFDELPLWSAAFGLLLFKHLELKPGITALDNGSLPGSVSFPRKNWKVFLVHLNRT